MSIVAFLDSLLYYYPYILGEKIFRIRKKILLSTFTAGFLIIFFGTFTAMKITSGLRPIIPIKYIIVIISTFAMLLSILFIIICEGYPELGDKKIGKLTLYEISIIVVLLWALIWLLLVVLT
ncbi:MAG: hypothetical protein QXN75_05410 [Thermoproteota archaeon]